MDLALTVLLLWGLLFVPLGIVLHWIVLGDGSRVRALPLAPVTGIATAMLVLATLGRLGIDAGEPWIAWCFIGVSVASVLVIWRCDVVWRSRELIGAGLLLLLAVTLIQLPVVGSDGEGPLGYGTTANPVVEVAAIDAAAGGPTATLEVAENAVATSDERPIGFEQFAALTVAIGLEDNPEDARTATWTAYGLHATITGMLAALITLPLFAFARARGVKWLGLTVLVPLGVVAPAVFIALANGEGAAIASIPFTTAAVFCLLVTRRDRGWWALLVLFGAAVTATAGPIALLPLVAIGVTWMLVRSDTYEHLSQHDAPVASLRTLAITGIAAGMGAVSVVPLLRSGGEQLAWSPLHDGMWDAVRSWPFAWLDTDLSVVGPSSMFETSVWMIGPALLAVAVIYAVVRNERRELGVLLGAIVAALIAGLFGLVELRAGIRLYEFTMLSLSPFLAALAIRAVALARENADGPNEGRLAGIGPTLLVFAFVLLSFAATTVTGTRMVHAPSVVRAASASGASQSTGTAIIAAGDPWLAFVVDGQRVRGGYADADAISEERNRFTDHGTRTTGFDQVLVSSSPLSSDPSLRYLEQSALDQYQVRGFADRLADLPPTIDLAVDSARVTQRSRTETADRPGIEGGVGADADDAAVTDAVAQAAEDARTVTLASVHTPVEGDGVNTPPDRPAGLLLPADDIEGCDSSRPLLDSGSSSTCEPDAPVMGPDCSDDDLAQARAHDDRDRPKRIKQPSARAQVLSVDADPQLPRRPTMLGIQCFEVPLHSGSTILMAHLRDVGLILPPEQAVTGGGSDAWERDNSGRGSGINGGERRTTSLLDATLTYGNGRLGNGLQYDLVLEGEFGAGVEISSGFATGEQDEKTGEPNLVPGAELATFRGSADGFSSIRREAPLSGSVTVANQAGTDISLGRLFARPRDLPRSCDVPLAIAAGQQREVRVDVASLDGSASMERPGLTVTVLGVDTDDDGARTARIAVASYLSRSGLPRYTLVDWTEQYESTLRVEGCDGATYVERGSAAVTKQKPVTPQLLKDMLADRGVDVVIN